MKTTKHRRLTNKTLKHIGTLILILISTSSFAQEKPAKLTVNPIFADHMVLQQKAKIKIWGTAMPSEKIILQASFLNNTFQTFADADGKWAVNLKTPVYGGPYEIKVKGAKDQINIKDVYLGEVWLASGQSNMEFPLDSIMRGYNGPDHYKEEVKSANHPLIRQFLIENTLSKKEEETETGEWYVCKPENAKFFSAVAYFFARDLQQNLNVPIGIINSAWGGTYISSWTSAKDLKPFKEDADKAKRITDDTVKINYNYPSAIYNAMIHPIKYYTVKGVIWNQGEKNVNHPDDYEKRMESMIKGWRQTFNNPDMTFIYVQIAPYNYMAGKGKYFFGEKTSLGTLVEQQVKAQCIIPNAFMARTADISDGRHIHYRNKQEVGNRLSLIALKEVYKKDIGIVNGPDLSQVKFQEDKVVVSFKNVGNGLKTNDKPISSFELSNDGNSFYPAKAVINGLNEVLVSSDQVKNPTEIRYCFNNTDTVNLWNSAGFPAVTFRKKK